MIQINQHPVVPLCTTQINLIEMKVNQKLIQTALFPIKMIGIIIIRNWNNIRTKDLATSIIIKAMIPMKIIIQGKIKKIYKIVPNMKKITIMKIIIQK